MDNSIQNNWTDTKPDCCKPDKLQQFFYAQFRKAVIPKRDYADRRLIDTSDEKFQNSPGLQRWAAVENLKIAAQTYNEVGSIVELEQKISAASATGKEAKQTVRKYESQIILYGGARRMLEQAGISLKGLNINKLKSEYPALTAQKNRSAEAPPFPKPSCKIRSIGL